jgi:hypothetical protein
MGRGGGVGELAELVQSYVEARVERCVSRKYALLYGDWICIANLLAESGVTEVDPLAILEPDLLIAALDLVRLMGDDYVIVAPAPATVVAVRMGSPSYDSIVKTLSRLTGYREEETRFEYLAVGREGFRCYTWHFWRAEGVSDERMAREIAKFIVGELRKAVREMVRYGMCRNERACLEKILAYLQTARECN